MLHAPCHPSATGDSDSNTNQKFLIPNPFSVRWGFGCNTHRVREHQRSLKHFSNVSYLSEGVVFGGMLEPAAGKTQSDKLYAAMLRPCQKLNPAIPFLDRTAIATSDLFRPVELGRQDSGRQIPPCRTSTSAQSRPVSLNSSIHRTHFGFREA